MPNVVAQGEMDWRQATAPNARASEPFLFRDAYIGLIGAVIRQALAKEGPLYTLSADGLYWCSLGGLDPMYVGRLAAGGKFQSGSNQQPGGPSLR